jgi:O-methyltransferase involved in polyketide biosynthesis
MPALVIAEGLLIYLTAEQVNTLARELHAVPNLRWWLIDLTSPVLLQMLNRDWGRTLQRGNAPYQFAPENGTEFFRPSGWREAKFRSAYDEARRLKRQVRQKWLWRFRLWRALGSPSFTQLHEIRRRMFGFVLLESEKKSGSVAGTPDSIAERE